MNYLKQKIILSDDFLINWHRPTFPRSSIIGPGVLDDRVRDGIGYFHSGRGTRDVRPNNALSAL